MVLLIFIAFISICIGVSALISYNRQKQIKISDMPVFKNSFFNESSLIIPRGLYYDKTHTWAFMEQNGLVKVGVDDFLVHITGPLNRIKMKKLGETVIKGEPVFTLIQNGKHLNVISPVSGIIKQTNKNLEDDISPLNNSSFSESWVYAIEPNNWSREIQFLLLPEKYIDWIKFEFKRFKDFLVTNVIVSNTLSNSVVMQDGGELKDNILADYGPEIWEEFQMKFINTSN